MRTRRRYLIPLAALLASLFLVSGVYAMYSQNYSLEWFTLLNSSGGGVCTSENYSVELTIGQTVSGPTSSPDFRLQIGYWVDHVTRYLLRMPLLLNGLP